MLKINNAYLPWDWALLLVTFVAEISKDAVE